MKKLGILFALMAALLSTTVAYAENVPTSLSFEVESVVSGDAPSAAETFTYVLEAEEETSPLPALTTISLEGSATASFGEIVFTQPGVYIYTIYQIEGNDSDYGYDTTAYQLIVYVVTDDDGVLSYMVLAYEQGSDIKVDQLLFENTYTDPLKNLSQTGDTTLFYYPLMCLTGSFLLMVIMSVMRKRRAQPVAGAHACVEGKSETMEEKEVS